MDTTWKHPEVPPWCGELHESCVTKHLELESLDVTLTGPGVFRRSVQHVFLLTCSMPGENGTLGEAVARSIAGVLVCIANTKLELGSLDDSDMCWSFRVNWCCVCIRLHARCMNA